MTSFLIMVDAGYFYAEAGKLIFGSPARKSLRLRDPNALRDCLTEVGQERTGASLLRMHWYDAAPHRQPMPEHRFIEKHRAIQVRLGRLTHSGSQKGVDSLIYRDLFVLSRDPRISDILLVGGDEDLLEGVSAAKDNGVRIWLIGIEPTATNQSEALIRAADERYTLLREHLEPNLYSTYSERRAEAVPATGIQQAPVGLGKNDNVKTETLPTEASTAADVSHIREAAVSVAREYWDRADESERSYLMQELNSNSTNRRLPQRTDGWMLRRASDSLGRWLLETEKWSARDEFWNEIAAIIGGGDERESDSQ